MEINPSRVQRPQTSKTAFNKIFYFLNNLLIAQSVLFRTNFYKLPNLILRFFEDIEGLDATLTTSKKHNPFFKRKYAKRSNSIETGWLNFSSLVRSFNSRSLNCTYKSGWG